MRNRIIYPALVCALFVNAWGDDVKPGIYTATMESMWTTANGKHWKAEVLKENGKTIAKCEILSSAKWSYKELWVWDDQTLVQTENGWGLTTGPDSKTYTATNTNGKYIVNCKNRESGDCDGGMEPSRYWTITATDDGFVYEAWGVPRGQDQTGTPARIHRLAFKLKK